MLEEAAARQKDLVSQKSRETESAVADLKAAAQAKGREAVRAILDLVTE